MTYATPRMRTCTPEEIHEGGGQEVVPSGYGASKDVGSSCNGDSSHRKILIKEADGSCSRQKEYNLSVLCSWKHLALEWKKIPDLGRRGMDRKMVHGTKRSMAESDS